MKKLTLSLGVICFLAAQAALSKEIPPLDIYMAPSENKTMCLHHAERGKAMDVACKILNLAKEDTDLLILLDTPYGYIGPVTSSQANINIDNTAQGYKVRLPKDQDEVSLLIRVIPESKASGLVRHSDLQFENQAKGRVGHYFRITCNAVKPSETNTPETNTVETPTQN